MGNIFSIIGLNDYEPSLSHVSDIKKEKTQNKIDEYIKKRNKKFNS